MIDLHLHLDGSLSEQDFIYLAKKQNIDLGKDFPNNIYVPSDCPSLEDYLLRFDLPCSLLQDVDSLAYATKSLVMRLASLGLIYAEIRFAPQLHTSKDLTQIEVCEAVLAGLNSGLKEVKNFDANIILCTMRHADEKTNLKTIEAAINFKGTKIVAVDLAGAEALHPCDYYKNIFDLAKNHHLNITIHAGEATDSDEIMRAIENGATRIGHGVHLSLDEKTIQRVNKNSIAFEFCPTSNLQTKSLLTYEEVPLRKFLKHNIKVFLNSDNMTVSNTNVNKEYSQMKKTFTLSKDEVLLLLFNAVNASFLPDNDKQHLKKTLLERIDEFYSII